MYNMSVEMSSVEYLFYAGILSGSDERKISGLIVKHRVRI